MDKSLFILVEGKDDKVFLEAILTQMHISNHAIKIHDINGWQNLEKLKTTLERNFKSGGSNLVIFDADFPTNSGGFELRKKKLLEQKDNLNISFDLFLFPNNSIDGDLETLLEYLINPKHKTLLDCFESYENCLKSKSEAYNLPARKAKIYAYITAFQMKKEDEEKIKKSDYLYTNPEYWDLNNAILEPLKQFLKNSAEEFNKS